jgi:hypothetical protein
MRYVDSSVFTKRKKVSPEELPEEVKTPGSPAKAERKAPANRKRKTPVSLVFFKSSPVTFQINRKDRADDFDRMAFVIKAVSKDADKKYYTVLHVEPTPAGSRLVATDGQRLHVAETSLQIKGGDYRPLVTRDCIRLGKSVKGIVFPNWRAVVPENTGRRGAINLEDTGMGKDLNQTERMSRAFNSFVKQTGELINLRFLEDLTRKTWSVHCQSAKGRPVVLREEGAKMDTFAVIMPLQEAGTGVRAA